MQRNDTVGSNIAPIKNTHISPTLPAPVTPETRSKRTIALRQLAIKHPKTAIVIAGVIVIGLIALAPTLATGLLFGGGLYQVNQFVDSHMTRGDQ